MSYVQQRDEEVAGWVNHDSDRSPNRVAGGYVNNDQAPPPYKPNPDAERFNYQGSKYRDLIFLVLFVIHLIGLIVIGGSYGSTMIKDIKNAPPPNQQPTNQPKNNLNENAMIGLLAVAAIVSAVFSAFWLRVMQHYSNTIIKLCMITTVCTMVISAIISLAMKSIILGVIYLVLAFFIGLWYYMIQNRIPLAQATLAAAVQALKTHSGPIYFVYVTALLYVGFLSFWSFCFVAVYHSGNSNYASNGSESGTGADQTNNPDNTYRFVLVYCLFSLYWTVNVIKNISHVTTAGTTASWWLQPDDPAPTKGAIWRACTTSLGSICFGSLILAVISTTRALLNMAKGNAERRGDGAAAFVACIAEWLLSCIESIVRFVSKYAYTFVAIFGLSFWEAANATGKLLQTQGFDVIINDDLSGMVLALGSFLAATVSGLIGGFYAAAVDFDGWQVFAVLAFMVGFVVALLFFSTVESAVATSFVVWASDPYTISITRPDAYNRIVEAAGQRYKPTRGFGQI